MAEFKKQSFNEYLAYMATKKMWNSIWILLLLDAILLAQFIYDNGEGFNIPVILCVCCLSIMCITTLIYAIYVKIYKKSKEKKPIKLIVASNIQGCILTFLSTAIIIARSFCATQGSNLVFANFAFITMVPIIFRIKKLPYLLTVGISYIFILMIEIYGGDATYLTLNTSFFFLVVYLSAALNALLITTSLYSTYNYQNKAYEVAEVQIKVSHELLKMNDKLSNETTLDYLTNLGNRKALMTDTKNIWDEFSDENRLVSVAMIDVDKFKPINDTYGHEVGDVVLKRIAQIISEISISFNGSAYRYGGEEFIMIFKDIEKQTAQEYMDNLSKHISFISFPEIENKKVSVSIGIYTDYPTSLNNFQDFLSEADRLMYIEKNKKKMKF